MDGPAETPDPSRAYLVRRIKIDVTWQASAVLVAAVLAVLTSGGLRSFLIIAAVVLLLSLAWRLVVLVYTLRHPEITGDG